MSQAQQFLIQIAQTYNQLSPQMRKVADDLRLQPMQVLQDSIQDIAARTGTSKATVSRFFRLLGYESHQALVQELTALRESGYPLAPQTLSEHYIQQEVTRLQKAWEHIDNQQFHACVDALVTAPAISLIGFRNSYPVALHMRQQLQQFRRQVRVLPQPGQTLGEELPDIASDELVILVAFRRRPAIIEKLLPRLAKHQVILLTDLSGQHLLQHVTHHLVCQLGQDLALDNYAAPMSVISVLCNKALQQMQAQAQPRIHFISRCYDDLDELGN